MKGPVERGDYAGWCRHYGYDPESDEAHRDWEEARRQLAILQRVDADHEAREAIERARGRDD